MEGPRRPAVRPDQATVAGRRNAHVHAHNPAAQLLHTRLGRRRTPAAAASASCRPSMSRRCCGSSSAASASDTPSRAASKRSTADRQAPKRASTARAGAASTSQRLKGTVDTGSLWSVDEERLMAVVPGDGGGERCTSDCTKTVAHCGCWAGLTVRARVQSVWAAVTG